jgi:Transposase DDE domain
MHLMQLLHKTFASKLTTIHKTRLKNVLEASSTLIKVNKLTLTALGRHLPNKAKTRSNIKKIDRLLSNSLLQREAVEIYKLMISYLIEDESQPWLHIDWSCVCSLTKMYVLRATLSMQGRSIVIYEEAHPKKKENNHAVHKAFLNTLKAILPPHVKPVIVTDAGFRARWFSYVQSMGWDFVGRLRNKNLVMLKEEQGWILSQSLHKEATGTPTYLGKGLLTETEKVETHFVLYKGKLKERYKRGHRRSTNKRYSKSHKEPWLLVSSLASTTPADQIVTIYRQRMRIEENFRDTKCTRYGFGLKESRSRSTGRMSILLLIAAIATFGCWLAGIFTQQEGKAAEFQAHSSKYRGILSTVYLGRESLKKGFRIGTLQFKKILVLLFYINVAAQLETCVYD